MIEVHDCYFKMQDSAAYLYRQSVEEKSEFVNELQCSEAEHQVERGLLLDVIVRKCPSVLQLFAGKNEPLLVWRDAFLILNLCFDIVDGVTRFHIQCNCFSCECFHKDLHATTQAKHQVERRLFLNVVVR